MAAGDEAGVRRYRMKDLCELTGLSRQAIHFYIQQGLLPEGEKTGRNMAWYGEGHLERLRTIRKLQQERLLPLRAIKAALEDDLVDVEPEQRELLLELKSRLSGELRPREQGESVDAAEALGELGVELTELLRMAELGLVGVTGDAAGGAEGLRVRREDLWVIELWGQLRAAGFTAELGFTVDDLAFYEEVVSSLFRKERQLVLERLARLPMAQVAEMMERALPLLHTFFAHSHNAKVRDFFAAME